MSHSNCRFGRGFRDNSGDAKTILSHRSYGSC